jgi:outer membrane lipoprotein SlyB
MKRLTLVALALIAAMASACTATTSATTMWDGPAYRRGDLPRHGQVEAIRVTAGNPVGGAVAGALIGGLLMGGRGPGALFGAAGGAAVGASMSDGSYETYSYEVLVRFDDGVSATFVYGGMPPWHRGDAVVLTQRGLIHG